MRRRRITSLLPDPPFFQALMDHTDHGNAAFDCPGHQGDSFRKTFWQTLYLYFGETLFRADSCNADVRLGDLLIHEGPAFWGTSACGESFLMRINLLLCSTAPPLQQNCDWRLSGAWWFGAVWP